MRKKVAKKDRKGEAQQLFLGTVVDQKSIKSRSHYSTKKRSPKDMEYDAKRVPKWSQNRCQNSSIINAKTGNGKDHGNHQK